MKKCKYCNGTGTKPVKPYADKDTFWNSVATSQCKTVEQCPKCHGKGFKSK